MKKRNKKMKKLIILGILISFTSLLNAQIENTYKLKAIFYNNNIVKGQSIDWNKCEPVKNNSEVLIRIKTETKFYLQITENNTFKYGGYFEYIGFKNNEYKYKRTDGTSNDFLFTKISLDALAKSDNYKNKVNLKIICYDTSEGRLFKF